MKTRIEITLLFIFCISIVSCVTYKINEEGYYRPKSENHKFKYKKDKTDPNTYSILDTTAIYYMPTQELYKPSDIYDRVGKYERKGNYLRFYSNGKFKLQGSEKKPKIEDINNIDKGIVGYFKYVNGVLKLEIFTDINAGSNQLEFAIVQDNGDINMLDENPRVTYGIGYSYKNMLNKLEKSVYNPLIYKKIKYDSMTYEKPNW